MQFHRVLCGLILLAVVSATGLGTMGKPTFDEMIAKVRIQLQDAEGNYWTDAEITDYLNEGQLEYCRKSRALRGEAPITNKENQDTYNLPDDCLEVLRIEDSDGNEIPRVTSNNLSTRRGNFRSRGKVGGTMANVEFCYSDLDGQGGIRFYPRPNPSAEEGFVDVVSLRNVIGSIDTVAGDLYSAIQSLYIGGYVFSLIYVENAVSGDDLKIFRTHVESAETVLFDESTTTYEGIFTDGSHLFAVESTNPATAFTISKYQVSGASTKETIFTSSTATAWSPTTNGMIEVNTNSFYVADGTIVHRNIFGGVVSGGASFSAVPSKISYGSDDQVYSVRWDSSDMIVKNNTTGITLYTITPSTMAAFWGDGETMGFALRPKSLIVDGDDIWFTAYGGEVLFGNFDVHLYKNGVVVAKINANETTGEPLAGLMKIDDRLYFTEYHGNLESLVDVIYYDMTLGALVEDPDFSNDDIQTQASAFSGTGGKLFHCGSSDGQNPYYLLSGEFLPSSSENGVYDIISPKEHGACLTLNSIAGDGEAGCGVDFVSSDNDDIIVFDSEIGAICHIIQSSIGAHVYYIRSADEGIVEINEPLALTHYALYKCYEKDGDQDNLQRATYHEARFHKILERDRRRVHGGFNNSRTPIKGYHF